MNNGEKNGIKLIVKNWRNEEINWKIKKKLKSYPEATTTQKFYFYYSFSSESSLSWAFAHSESESESVKSFVKNLFIVSY